MREINLDIRDPLVTIIVPVYNAEKFLVASLNSLISQKFQDIEIIVVNDGSTDGSAKVIEHFSFYRNLRYFEKENGGTGSALNLGHRNARGRYITWCSADNIYFPDFVSTFIEAFKRIELEKAPVELLYSDFCYIMEDGRRIRDIKHVKPQTGADLIAGYDIGMSFMYTKNLWNKTGEYWNRICEDFNWCVRAAQHTNFGLVQAVLAAFRVHSNQITGSNKTDEKAAADDCKKLAQELFGEKCASQ